MKTRFSKPFLLSTLNCMPNDLHVGVLFVKSNCIAKLFFAVGVFFLVTTSVVGFLDFRRDFLVSITRVFSSMTNSPVCELDSSCMMSDGAFSIVRVSSYVFLRFEVFERTDLSLLSSSKRELCFKFSSEKPHLILIRRIPRMYFQFLMIAMF